MEIFQGWYKDGTEGTRDYRPTSALYLLMRCVFCFAFVAIMISMDNNGDFWGWYITGTIHVFLGAFFFTAKPYKRAWMNHVDGQILMLAGVFLLTVISDNKTMFVLGIVVAVIVLVISCLCTIIIMWMSAKTVTMDSCQ